MLHNVLMTVQRIRHMCLGVLSIEYVWWYMTTVFISSAYDLPESDGELTINVHVPDEYVLTDFEWFGVYDHCAKVLLFTWIAVSLNRPQKLQAI